MEKESINQLVARAAKSSTEKDNRTQISFSIRLTDRIYFVVVKDIALMYLEGNSVYLLDDKGEKHVISKTLDALEKAVASEQFYRINRQMIVNRHAIRDVAPYTNQRIVVHLTVPTPEKVIVPRLKVTNFLTWMEKG